MGGEYCKTAGLIVMIVICGLDALFSRVFWHDDLLRSRWS
jgi:hypothetical protein